ncbi:ABC transporter ATP-binding protein [Iamia sp. SCSIO 61187]|nr:ABC transporter ATP-binding protein [Iamia sp. SCSIO 61187]
MVIPHPTRTRDQIPPVEDAPDPRSAGGLAVEGLVVRFGATTAVAGVDLAVAPGEVVALLGPSGCGKSTLLRAVAGLEAPAAGTVRWDGVDITRLTPDRRGFGLMFQDHALFPHRTVGQNVAFGLRMAGRSRAEQAAGVDAALARVGLAGFADRTVDTLSGGEAQRVALARALAPEPRLLMLDEPLGSLDRVLRDELAVELRRVLGELGLAAVHVTHDQEEAYAVADRIVVMRAGAIVRDGPAAAVWRDPGSAFVARFLGHADVLDADDARRLGLPAEACVVQEAALTLFGRPSSPVEGDGDGQDGLGGGVGLIAHRAQVLDVRFRGATSRVVLDVDGVVLSLHTSTPPAVGAEVEVTVDPAHVRPVTPDGAG